MIVDYSMFPEIKTVKAEEVEWCTRAGWVLIEIVPATNVATTHVQKTREVAGYPQPYSEQALHVVEQPLFVLGRARDTVIDDLRVQLGMLQKQEVQSQKAVTDAEARAKAAENNEVRQAQCRDAADKRVEALTSVNEELRATLKKMERDLAKIREALGTTRMKEILG